MDGMVSRAEEEAHVAREAAENAKEEATQSKEQAISAEEATAKAWEEAARYKDEVVELDRGKRIVESDLAATQSAYAGLKEAHLKSKIARGTVEEAEKKAREDLEVEQSYTHSLSIDVDRLKKALREKE